MRPAAAMCKRGHDLAPPNVYVGTQLRFCKRLNRLVSYPRRECVACYRERRRVFVGYGKPQQLSLPAVYNKLVTKSFSLNNEELAFLGAHVTPKDTVFEWGSGVSTVYLAQRCNRLITVEHNPTFAASVLLWAFNSNVHNVSVMFVPASLPYTDGTEDDGDRDTFREYVGCYTGQGVDVILVDGRARVECGRQILEHATHGPDPSTRIFVHDIDRAQLAPLLEMFQEEARVGKLALLRVRE